MDDSLLTLLLNVLYKRLASQEVVSFFRGEKFNPKRLNELKLMLVSANALLKYAKYQFTEPNVKTWLERLEQVLNEVERMIDENNTEALPLNLEKGESRSKASMCLNSSPALFSPCNSGVKSEIEEILGTLQDLLDQRVYLYLKDVEPKLQHGYFWYAIEGRYGMVYKLREEMFLDHLKVFASRMYDVAHGDDDDDSGPTWNDVHELSFASG
ncbi:hypothetical protein TorRG33x02_175290 [Trema orientale]|uniref:Disease resistance N-terminal domain-containing protein n=1 Tax=Trema orientale TaxID=63057 RepID=A0A2P5EM97_TREOI|nr:hypothetical protein TorRG33x02_175290 [Trema orientale]